MQILNQQSHISFKKKNTTNIPYTTKFDQKYFDTLTENGQKIVENIATDIENVGQSDGNFKLIILGALTPVAAGTDGKPDEDKAYNDNVETVNFLRSLLPTTLAQTCDPIPAPPATDRAIPIAWA